MARNTIRDVWLEGQIDDNGIGLSLIAETGEGAVIQEIEHFTFEELQSASGDLFTLNLGDSARESLSEMREDANVGRILQAGGLEDKAEELPDNPSTKELLAYMGFIDDRPESEIRTGYELPDVADVMRDTNPADWSNDDRVRVIEVTETPASEYVIQESDFGRDKTVADANPSEPADAPVVVANYVGGDKEYAFPVTRLEQA